MVCVFDLTVLTVLGMWWEGCCHILSCFLCSFLLFFSTHLFSLLFIQADIAAISCLPHNEQVCYQLLKGSQEWTPAFFSPHYLAWNITHLLIYLVYSCFKAMTCFFFLVFFLAKAPNNVPIHLLFSTPQTIGTPRRPSPPKNQASSIVLHLVTFFFSSLKQKVISSVPSLSTAHARRTHYFILLWTLLNLAQKQFFINIFIHLWLLSKSFAYEHTLSLSFSLPQPLTRYSTSLTNAVLVLSPCHPVTGFLLGRAGASCYTRDFRHFRMTS